MVLLYLLSFILRSIRVQLKTNFLFGIICLKILLLSPIRRSINAESLKINKELKRIRKSIQSHDLIIAATAKLSNYLLATINERHFKDIENLDLITTSSFEP